MISREEREAKRERANACLRLAPFDSSGGGKRRQALARDVLELLDALDEAEGARS